jgi:hypothetical protein
MNGSLWIEHTGVCFESANRALECVELVLTPRLLYGGVAGSCYTHSGMERGNMFR